MFESNSHITYVYLQVLMITDSHGRGLESKFNELWNGNFEISVRPGLKIEEVGQYISRLSPKSRSAEIVILHAGTCNLTFRNGSLQDNPRCLLHKYTELLPKLCHSFPSDTLIVLSSVLPRDTTQGGNKMVNDRTRYINRALQNLVPSYGMYFVDHTRLFLKGKYNTVAGSFSDGIHLTGNGKDLLCLNIIDSLNYLTF